MRTAIKKLLALAITSWGMFERNRADKLEAEAQKRHRLADYLTNTGELVRRASSQTETFEAHTVEAH